jgi:prophage regulatory protein
MGRMINHAIPISMEAEMRRSYMDYAMSVITSRRRHAEWADVCISSSLPTGTVCEADADGSDSPGADGAPAASSDDDDGGDPDPEPARPRSCNTPPPAIAPHPHGTPRRTATATDGDSLPPPPDPVAELWRLPLVLAHIPISRSSWFAGVKAGRYPQPVRLSDRRVAWRASDIRSFVAAL